MKKLISKEFIIGISVIGAILILIFGIDYLKGINIFKPANFYVANYKNIAGLGISAPVNIEGFKVGQVREINFDYDNPGDIEVVLALNKSLHLPEDSRAVITNSLMNGAAVEIYLGKSEKMLEVGGTIPTGVKPDLMNDLSDKIMPSIEGILPKIDSILISINTLVSDPSLLKSVQSLENITSNINKASEGLNVVVNRQVPGVMNNASQAAANLNTMTKELSELSTQLKTLPLAQTVSNVNDLTENLIKFSNQLNDKNSTLGLLMNDPELYNRLNTVATDIDSLILDIKKNPKRYINIKVF